jgi:flagellar protein FliL
MADIPVLEPAAAEAPSPGKGKWLTIVIAVVLVAAGASAGAWLGPFLTHSSSTPKKAKAEKIEPVVKGPALYAALDPPFVVNFEAEQLVRFLQVTVQVMSREQPTLDLLKANDPVVRNDLLLLFGGQKYSVISTSEGKEKLRAQALEVVRKVIAGAGGKPESVEQVYFTSFVMQ